MITRTDIKKAQRSYYDILNRMSKESIYSQFKAKCKEKKRSIKSVLIELMRKWLEDKI